MQWRDSDGEDFDVDLDDSSDELEDLEEALAELSAEDIYELIKSRYDLLSLLIKHMSNSSTSQPSASPPSLEPWRNTPSVGTPSMTQTRLAPETNPMDTTNGLPSTTTTQSQDAKLPLKRTIEDLPTRSSSRWFPTPKRQRTRPLTLPVWSPTNSPTPPGE